MIKLTYDIVIMHASLDNIEQNIDEKLFLGFGVGFDCLYTFSCIFFASHMIGCADELMSRTCWIFYYLIVSYSIALYFIKNLFLKKSHFFEV